VVFVSRQLGHANPTVTLTVYAHLFRRAEHINAARQALQEAYQATQPNATTPGENPH
jgi:integrase